MSVTIANKLPKDDTNGLAALEARLAEDTDSMTVVVGVVRTDSITRVPHNADHPRKVTVALLHVEALTDKDATAADKMMRKAYETRTGKRELPFDGGDEG